MAPDSSPATSSDPSRRLIQLRWMAVVGVCSVLIATGPVLALLPVSWPPYAIVLLLAAWNGVLTWRAQRGLTPQSTGSQLALDLLLLGALLASTGGLLNPFAIFLVVQVVLAAILAPTLALPVGSLAALLLLLLAGLGATDMLPGGTTRAALPQGGSMQWGVALALLVTCTIAVPFALRIMGDLRARESDAARYHADAERERVQLEAAIAAVGAGLLMTDARGLLAWHNPKAAEIFPDLRVGKRLCIDGQPWPRDEDLGSQAHIETRIERRDADGRVRHHAIGASVVHAQAGQTQLVVVATDITAQRAAERQLHSTEKLSALGRLAAGMAHEINTPLASVRLLAEECSEAVEQERTSGCAALQDCKVRLTEIRGETERISGLVRRFLDLAHPGSPRIEPVDVPALVLEAVGLVSLRDPALRQRISTHAPCPVPALNTSRDQLLQVLLNALDNAVDATRATQGAIKVTVTSTNARMIVDIEDEGHGLDPQHLTRLFEPFFTTKAQGEGTGLGLYVSFEIVQNLGGRIALEPRPRGACLHLEFPITVAS
ncbi:MAG: GHKL domain-containing protein [Planctomycetes bacterium]|nr:GHKL domain-containing protein [Planctomycetota bacterium]